MIYTKYFNTVWHQFKVNGHNHFLNFAAELNLCKAQTLS